MLRRSLFQLVAFYATSIPTPELQRIATIHDRLGVREGMYDQWLDALVETVRAHDPACDEATALAWCWAMTPGLTYMKLFSDLRAG